MGGSMLNDFEVYTCTDCHALSLHLQLRGAQNPRFITRTFFLPIGAFLLYGQAYDRRRSWKLDQRIEIVFLIANTAV